MAAAPTVWVLADDRPGNAGQCLGVADALGLPYTVKTIAYGPWAALPNLLMGASLAGMTAESRAALTAPWPDLVVAAGRRTAPVARAVKSLAGGRPFLVQIMDPGPGGRDAFDLIAVPRHDGVRSGGNILPIVGAPHRVTAGRLAEAAAIWAARFADLPGPRIGVVVGGSTRRRRFTAALGRDLGVRAAAMAAAAKGSLLVTTSRRTGPAAEALLAAISGPAFCYRWGAGGDNPYLGILGSADALVVTGDSVSMASEAAASTVPLYLFAPPFLTTAKHARFHADLYRDGYARPFDGTLAPWSHPPLNAAGEIAATIRKRLGLP